MGYQFKAGRRALLIVYNMLKQSYDLNHPYAFEIERHVPAKLKHLNFGHGAHFCLGFPLAHGEIELVLQALFALPRNPRILSRAYSRGKTFPAYTQIRLELAP
jgi:cytochrome P450